MATVRKIGEKWVADYRDAAGRRHREFRATKKAAEALLAERQVTIAKGTYSATARTATFETLAKRWLETAGDEWRPNTARLRRLMVERHLLHDAYGMGARRVARIDVAACEDFKKAMKAANPELSARTLNLALQTLGAVLRYGQALGWMHTEPARHVRRHKDEPKPVQPLSAEERGRLLAAAEAEGADTHLAVNLGLRAALRLGEVMALCWRDVDAEGKVLRVSGTNSCRADREAFQAKGTWPTTKTEESARTVALSPELLAEIQRYRLLRGRPEAGALLFPSQAGTPIDPNTWRSREWRRVLVAAKLDRHTHFHALRHTGLSEMIAAGLPLEWVRMLAGHRTLDVTLRVYRAFVPRDLATAEAIDRALANGSGQ